MQVYSKDDYDYLIRNGCYPDGYVEGLGLVSSDTVSVISTSPSYPNDRALGIDRRTQFMSTIQIPVIKPLIAPQAPKHTHEELKALMTQMINENIVMPAFSNDLRKMVIELKEEISKKRSKNLNIIREAQLILEKDAKNKRALKKINKAEDENRKLDEVEREIKKMAVSNQRYEMVTNQVYNADAGTVYYGDFRFDKNSGIAYLGFKNKKPKLSDFAHELKHAYQFETGRLSSPSFRSTSGNYVHFLYDKEDEREAFERGKLFGSGENFESNNNIYNKVPDSRDFQRTNTSDVQTHSWRINTVETIQSTVITPEDLHTYELILENPNVPSFIKAVIELKLQNFSRQYNVAFRVNGKTYYNP